MSDKKKYFFFRHIYLLLTAAWLITIAFIIDNYWSANANPSSVQKKITEKIQHSEKDFERLIADESGLNALISADFKESFLQKIIGEDYFLFVYSQSSENNQTLVKWNTNVIIPDNPILQSTAQYGFSQLSNGYYVWKKKKIGSMLIVALIPVKWNYFVDNNYLKNTFVNEQILSNEYDIHFNNQSGVQVYNSDGHPLFKIYQKSAHNINRRNLIAILLLIVANILLLVYLHLLAVYIANRFNAWVGFLSLIIFFVLIRMAGMLFHLPYDAKQFSIFDPGVFHKGYLFYSLGDLIVNLILMAWLVFYFQTKVKSEKISFKHHKIWVKWMVLFLVSGVLIFLSFFFANTIRSLIVDSNISFDVTNFFTLDQYTIAGFVAFCIFSVIYFISCNALVQLIIPLHQQAKNIVLMLSVVFGLVYLSFRVGDLNGGFDVVVVMWMTAILLIKINTNLSDFMSAKVISSKLVFWLAFFSAGISSLLFIENNRKELTERKHFAEVLALRSDPANETLVKSMLTDFRDDYLIRNLSRFGNADQRSIIKDSIISSNTSGYTNKYNTSIYLFDDKGRAVENEDSTSLDELNAIISNQSSLTGVEGLYTYNRSFDQFTYLFKKNIRDTSGNKFGTLFILATPKKQKRDALYPELFAKSAMNSIENSPLYAIAIYNDWKLVNSFNDYPFPSQINSQDFTRNQFQEKITSGYSELWYYAGADKVVVIAKQKNNFIELITLFSYLFCVFLILSSILWITNTLVSSQLKSKNIFSYWKLSIRNQIHGTIIIITVISFIIIGLASILFFIKRFEANNREKLSRTIRIMEKQIKSSLSEFSVARDTGQSRLLSNDQFDREIEQISEIHGLDVNLYDPNGNLLVTSLPLPYTKGVLSTKMNPVAYYHLGNKNEIQFYQKEEIGSLSFMSNYIPVADANGKLFAYLNLPYFTSQNNLRQEISNFLVVIINLNAFIFLLAGIISLFITNRISNVFNLIGEKMRKMNLGKQNEMIEWKRDDEIGALVQQYNKMVQKLEESAQALAKSEREGAWREMARQVAHEIKNPLTPMKLSMQFLQKSIDNNAQDIQNLTRNVAKTLIEQIDHLTTIANDFSQFASIGESVKSEIDLNEILRNVGTLHQMNERAQLLIQLTDNPNWIFADKTQINRLFTNLIVNAIQSVPEERTASIIISQYQQGDRVITMVRDNGTGIDEEAQQKIFTPNFTTKTSGTGLGLAMCKRIVEQSDGSIWFNTIAGEGTTFFVSLPLLRKA